MPVFDPDNQATWPQTLTTEQAAKVLRDSTATVYELVADGTLPCLPRRKNQKVRIPRDQFIEWLGANPPKPSESQALKLMNEIRKRGACAQMTFFNAWRGMVDGKHPMARVIENQFEMIAAALDHALVERVAAEVLKSS